MSFAAFLQVPPWQVMGEPLLLPQAVLGLAEWDGQLVALSSDGLRLLGSMATSFGVMTLPQRWQNPLELVQVHLEAAGKVTFWGGNLGDVDVELASQLLASQVVKHSGAVSCLFLPYIIRLAVPL